jgi:protein-S-isoprenylcysteine O-methyltransferase Ste14
MRKLLPPFLLLLILAGMFVVDTWLPLAELPFSARPWAALLIVAGVILSAVARAHFARVRTEINTFGTPNVLVMNGPFRFSRNPMYLGFALVALGSALLHGSLSSLLLAVTFVVVTDRYYIGFEERVMHGVFGTRYGQYARQTRRWL